MHRKLFLLTNIIAWINISAFIQAANSGVNIFEKSLLLITGAAIICNRKIIPGNIVIVGLLVILLTFSACGTDSPSFQWIYFVSGLASLVSVFSLLLGELTEEDAEFFLKVLAAGALAVVAIGCVYQALGVWEVLKKDENGAFRLAGSTIPAFMGSYAYVSAFSAAVLWDRLGQLRYVVLGALSLVFLILSGARMPLAVAFPLCGIVFIHSTRLSLPAKLLAGLYALASIGIVFAAVGQETLQRFKSNSLSGREKLWNVMLNVADAHPIFGIGLGHQQLYISRLVKATTGTIASHNEYIRLSMEIGYVGATVFFGLFIAFFVNMLSLKQVSRKPLFFAAVLSFLIYALTDNVLSNSMILILLAGYCASIMPAAEAGALAGAEAGAGTPVRRMATPQLAKARLAALSRN